MSAFILTRGIAGFAAVMASLCYTIPGASAETVASKPLPCHAAMSNARPADYTTTTVQVRSVAHAHVSTVAHYKTVNRWHYGRTNGRGRAGIPYYISGATPGYQVIVNVYVKWPHRSGTCQTSFTPHS
jgi:hypothetical protein